MRRKRRWCFLLLFFLFPCAVLAEEVPPPNFKVTNEMIYRELLELKLHQARMEERFEERFKAFDEKFKALDEKFKAFDEKFKAFEEKFKAFDEKFNTINERFKTIEAKIEANARAIEANARAIDRQTNIFLAIFGALIALLVFVIGFAIWDRRAAVRPLREEVERIKGALREYSEREGRLAEVLRHFGLL